MKRCVSVGHVRILPDSAGSSNAFPYGEAAEAVWDRQGTMFAKKLTGAQAGVRKYDLLTALAVAGLAGGPGFCTSMTRLIALVTARYNWQRDEVTISQDDLARMWSVDKRTVKRELKRLREHGILLLKRAGVRGRVSAYALDHSRIAQLTEEVWPLVGPDFQGRMAEEQGRTDTTVIPFPREVHADTEWGQACRVLADADTARYRAWFAPLVRAERSAEQLALIAPSGFHADYVTRHLLGDIARAVNAVDPRIVSVEIRPR